jgi:hypothetical protein
MSGFTQEAQDYAIAHQISLVDLSGPSFAWLRDAIAATGRELRAAAEHCGIGTFPVAWMRTLLRHKLQTAPHHLLPNASTGARLFRQQAERAIEDFVNLLESHAQVELLLGFPSAPFILPLATTDKATFLRYAAHRPSHSVRLRRTTSDGTAEWTAQPTSHPDAYVLTFNLPERLEDWITADEQQRRRRARSVKEDFLSSIMVYYLDDGVRTCQLRYEPADLRRDSAELRGLPPH